MPLAIEAWIMWNNRTYHTGIQRTREDQLSFAAQAPVCVVVANEHIGNSHLEHDFPVCRIYQLLILQNPRSTVIDLTRIILLQQIIGLMNIPLTNSNTYYLTEHNYGLNQRCENDSFLNSRRFPISKTLLLRHKIANDVLITCGTNLLEVLSVSTEESVN